MNTHFPPLADYLTRKGLTQAEFAARIGVKQAAVSRILTGRRAVSKRLALRIADETDIPIRQLLEWSASEERVS